MARDSVFLFAHVATLLFERAHERHSERTAAFGWGSVRHLSGKARRECVSAADHGTPGAANFCRVLQRKDNARIPSIDAGISARQRWNRRDWNRVVRDFSAGADAGAVVTDALASAVGADIARQHGSDGGTPW